MLIGEYDYEMDMQEKQEKMREEMQEKIKLLSVSEAAAEMGVSEDTFLKWMTE